MRAAALGCSAALMLGGLALGGFVLHKTRAVAQELVDPPFYRPQPLPRVEKTYAELAVGQGEDPGGVWSSQEVAGVQLWRLRRARPAQGIVVLLHGFGDDRWGTSPALRWFPELDAAIFTYLRRDEALRAGSRKPYVTFGVRESQEVVRVIHALEDQGTPRDRILLMGRSLGASVGLLALARLEAEGRGPLGGIVWEGAPASSRDFAERLVRGPRDHFWHFLAPAIGRLAAVRAGRAAGYDPAETVLLDRVQGPLKTPALCFLATQDRLAPPAVQREMMKRFACIRRVEVPTWHLNCAPVLGPRYAGEIRMASRQWLSR